MSENHEYSGSFPDSSRLSLQADCENCFGLCCVALPFAASADFATDKVAGQPCQNLQSDFRCGVHNSLRQRGFRGCTVYDCFGAGQKVSRVTFGGHDWRQAPGSAKQMFEVFPIMRQLHELLCSCGPAKLVRAEALRSQKGTSGRRKTYGRGADLIGAKLRGADFRGANLRGAYLIAADLTAPTLEWLT